MRISFLIDIYVPNEVETLRASKEEPTDWARKQQQERAKDLDSGNEQWTVYSSNTDPIERCGPMAKEMFPDNSRMDIRYRINRP